MSKRLNRGIAIFLSLLMILSVFPVNLIAFSAPGEDVDPAAFSFTVTDGETAAAGAKVTLYAKSEKVEDATASAEGLADFSDLAAETLATLTKAVITYDSRTVTVAGGFTAKNYTVDLTDAKSYASNTISVAEEFNLTYGESVSMNASASGGTLEYASGDTSVVEVSEDGTLTPVGVGSTTVSLYAPFRGDYADSWKMVPVTVNPSDKAITGFALGNIDQAEEKSYANTAILADGATGTVTYKSSDESYATVDSATGTLTVLKGSGSATITATFTPDDTCKNYTTSTESYQVSSSYVVSYDKENKYTNEGTITVERLFSGDSVTFTVDGGEEYAAANGIISVGKTAEIPEGKSTIAVKVNGAPVGSVTVYKDTVKPDFVLSNANKEDVYLKKPFDISVVNIEDATSGIASIQYTVKNGDKTTTVTLDAGESIFGIDVSAFADGTNLVTITIKDMPGNEAVASCTLMKDATAPVITSSYNNDNKDVWFNNDAKTLEVSFNEPEDASALKSVQYVLDNAETPVDIKEKDGKYPIDIGDLKLDEGRHTLLIKAADEAGNESEKSIALNFDKTAPGLNVAYDFDDIWVNTKDKVVTISGVEDGLSGIASLRYYIGDDENAAKEVEAGTVTLEELGVAEGSQVVTFVATDKAGNETAKTITVKLDTSEPVVGEFDFKEVGESSPEEILNALTFGKFFNKGIKVTVEIQDEPSGLTKDAITLKVREQGSDKELTIAASSYNASEGKAVFYIYATEDDLAADGVTVFKGTVAVAATDGAGNQTEVDATSQNSDTIGEIMWEVNEPVVSIDLPEADYTAESVDWYQEAVATVNAADDDSGIRKMTITVNDIFVYEFEAKTIAELKASDEVEVDFSLLGENLPEDGVYTVKVEVTDAAGNCNSDETTFTVDSTDPVITGFTFNGEANVDEFKNESADKSYMYYFNEDTLVEITASDNGANGAVEVTSGLKDITYKIVDVSGTETEQTAAVDENGKVSFTVQAGFKGNIYAKASDNVGRTSGDYVSPDSIIIENQEHHDAQEAHITMTLEGYTENCYFNKAVQPVITISDLFSGIQTVSVKVTGDALENSYDETVAVAEGYDGWTATAAEDDENLIVGLTRTLDVNENCNNITIEVSMTDNCGNTTKETYTFNIDTTAPVVDASFDDSLVTNHDNYWYNNTRTLNVEVTERDFDCAWNVQKKNADGDYEPMDTSAYAFTVKQAAEEGTNGDVKISEASVVFADEGEYKVAYTITDKAGNSVRSDEVAFGIDKSAPVLESVTIDGTNITDLTDIENGDGKIVFDAAKDGAVEVRLNDGDGCGVQKIEYYTVNEKQEVSDRVAVDAANGSASFSLPSGFIGKLYIIPYDKLENKNDSIDVTCWTSESKEEHEESSVLTITGIENNAVYDGPKSFHVEIADPAGISRLEWSIKSNTLNKGVLDAEAAPGYGWTIGRETADLESNGVQSDVKADIITSASKDFYIDENCNDITVVIRYVDLAGNASEKTVIFTIDTTDPVLSLSMPEASFVSESGNEALPFYNTDVETGLTVIERNFTQFDITVLKDGEPYVDYRKTQDQTTDGELPNQDDRTTTSALTFTQDGRYDVTVSVTDTAGRSDEKSVSFVIDKTKPVISEVLFKSDSATALERLVNIFTFGMFYNDTVIVEINAADPGVASGIKEYYVFIGDQEYKSADNLVEIPYDEARVSPYSVLVTVTDNAGNGANEEDKVSVTSEGISTNAYPEADTLLIETKNPEINIAVPQADLNGDASFTDAEGNIWFKDDAEIVLTLSDTDSGLRQTVVTVNGQTMVDKTYSEAYQTTDIIRINTANAVRGESGEYAIAVSVWDNAGNTYDDSTVVYKDIDAPVITAITFDGIDSENARWQDFLNLLSFGIFFNNDVHVTVTAEDRDPATGVSSYTLYVGDSEPLVSRDGSFTISFRDYETAQTISATATDNVGNTCAAVKPTQVSTNAKNDNIQLEQNNPNITISVPEKAAGIPMYTDPDGKEWFVDDVDFTVDIHDIQSGIRSVEVSVNGVPMEIDRDFTVEKVTDFTYTVSTGEEEIVRSKNGGYTIRVSVVDNAGNSSSASRTIYKDDAAPEVTDMTFVLAETETSVVKSILNLLTFGIFSNDSVKITVKAADSAPSTGIKEYTLYVGDDAPVTSANGVFVIDYEDYEQAKQILVTAADNAGNVSGKTSPTDKDVNSNAGSDQILMERELPRISIDIADTDVGSYVEENGNIWFANSVVFTVNATDADAGIHTVSILLNGKPVYQKDYSASLTKAETISVNTGDPDLNNEKVETKEDGSYTLEVTVTDNAGNPATMSKTIFEERTAPVINSITFSGENDESDWSNSNHLLAFGSFARDDVHVKVSAEEPAPASGIREYTLYVGDDTPMTSADGEFTISYSDYKAQAKEIYVTVTDNVGNTTAMTAPTEVTTNAKNNTLLLEREIPALTLTTPADGENGVARYEADGKVWYSDDIGFTIDTSDAISGLGTMVVTLNGKTMIDKNYNVADASAAVMNETIIVKTNDKGVDGEVAEINSDGSYVLTVVITDNAGNVHEESMTIYKDIAAPIVTDVTITGVNAENAAWQDVLNLLSFGIFFNNDVTVTVSAYDPDPASGIKTYTLYVGDDEPMVSTDGRFTIPFSEYSKEKAIRLSVADNLGNTIANVNPTDVNTNAKNNTILLEQTTPAIAISLPQNGANSVTRYDFNGKVWYSDDISFEVVVKDEQSGIRSVNASINDVVLVDETWNATEKVTQKSYSLSTASDGVKRNADGSYLLSVSVVDNAGNQYSDTAVVYKDIDKPIVTDVTFEAADENTTWKDVLNLLSFGIFFNNNVRVNVEGTDPDVHTGIAYYSLYLDGELLLKEENGVFTIPFKVYESPKLITVTCTDYVGNVSKMVKPTEVNSDTVNDELLLEKTAPTVNIDVPSENTETAVRYMNTETGCLWFSGDIDFTVDVEDTASGIRQIEATLNGKPVVSNWYNEEMSNAEQIVVNTADKALDGSGIARASDGSYELSVVATDNAGNTSEVKTEKIYVDTTAPLISSIEFIDENGKSQKTGDIIKYDETKGTYIMTCQKSITIVMTVVDNGPSAGLELSTGSDSFIAAQFTPVDGEAFTPDSRYITCNRTETQPGSYTYTWSYYLEEDFKGSVSATATDRVGNTCTQIDPGSLIIETPEQHLNEMNHITMTLADYTPGYYYNHTVTPIITVKDEYAGIRDVGIEVTANGNEYTTIYTRDIEPDHLQGWTDAKIDKNHVAQASMAIPINIESNDIVIRVVTVDNSSNVTTQEYNFHIDLTSPVITCTLTSSATPINRYYSASVTANITVTEHNFDPNGFTITEGSIAGWTQNGDVWTTTATFAAEGGHQFTLSMTDLAKNTTANNGSEGTFYVDNTDPQITVVNMANGQTNNDSDDIQFTIQATDALCLASNPLSTTFTVWYKDQVGDQEVLTSKQFSLTELADKGFIKVATSSTQTQFSYIITLLKGELDNDGIYSFVCSVLDMSGRRSNTILYRNADGTSGSSGEFELSLNRNGSTYKICWQGDSGNIDQWEEVNGTMKDSPSNIAIKEYNPNEIQADAVGTKMTMYDGVDTADVLTAPVKSDEKFALYMYEISRADYFDSDGYYTLNVESVDAAGNVSDGADMNHCSVNFTVDSTAPVIKTDLENAAQYNEAEHTFTISLDDLTACRLTVADKDGNAYDVLLEDGTKVAADNLLLDGVSKKVSLVLSGVYDEINVTATDALNHKTETQTYRSLAISTNRLTLMFATLNRHPWSYAIIAAVPVLLIGAAIIVSKRKKKDDGDKPAEEKGNKKNKKQK